MQLDADDLFAYGPRRLSRPLIHLAAPLTTSMVYAGNTE
jgi:hypothetical protein